MLDPPALAGMFVIKSWWFWHFKTNWRMEIGFTVHKWFLYCCIILWHSQQDMITASCAWLGAMNSALLYEAGFYAAFEKRLSHILKSSPCFPSSGSYECCMFWMSIVNLCFYEVLIIMLQQIFVDLLLTHSFTIQFIHVFAFESVNWVSSTG